MGKRRTPRFQKNLPVRLYGLDSHGKPFSIRAETVDISFSGARIAGVTQFEAPGETIGLEAEGKKGRFLVVWVGRAKMAGQVGVRNVDPRSCIWSMSMPPEAEDKFRPRHIVDAQDSGENLSYLEWRQERRNLRRVPVKAGARLKPEDKEQFGGWGMCTEVNSSGCYVETMWPLPPDSRLEITLHLNGRDVHASGIVRNTRPGWGMGIKFSKISPEDLRHLAEVVESGPRLGPARKSSQPTAPED